MVKRQEWTSRAADIAQHPSRLGELRSRFERNGNTSIVLACFDGFIPPAMQMIRVLEWRETAPFPSLWY